MGSGGEAAITQPPNPVRSKILTGFFRWQCINKSMIQVCPNCGHSLQRELNDGLTHCTHCNQLFDSSDYNRLLSAAWQVRREHLSLEQIRWQLKLDNDLCILVNTYINDYGYSHDEFVKLLKKLGVANKAYLNYSA